MGSHGGGDCPFKDKWYCTNSLFSRLLKGCRVICKNGRYPMQLSVCSQMNRDVCIPRRSSRLPTPATLQESAYACSAALTYMVYSLSLQSDVLFRCAKKENLYGMYMFRCISGLWVYLRVDVAMVAVIESEKYKDAKDNTALLSPTPSVQYIDSITRMEILEGQRYTQCGLMYSLFFFYQHRFSKEKRR